METEAESQTPSLKWQDEQGQAQIYYLQKPEIVIGRHPTCDVVLNMGAVSRVHAILSLRRVRYFIEDQQSKLGTSVNGQFVATAVALEHGDVLSIGTFELTFFDPLSTFAENLPPKLEPKAALTINLQTGQVLLDDKALGLSPKEYSLLAFLYANRERSCTRDEIRVAVWSEREPDEVTDLEIDALVARLRRKIDSGGDKRNYIVTVRSIKGFRFSAV